VAGQRTALNLSGLARGQVPRGSVIGTPGLFRATERIDVQLQLLAEASRAVKFRDPVHFHLGTARAVARVILLDRDQLQPGEGGIVQLVLDQPLMAHRGDRFIIRSYSPMQTIGGGLVIDSAPKKHKRFRQDLIQQLKNLASGDLGFWLQKLESLGAARLKELEKQTGSGREHLLAGLEQLRAAGQVELLAEQWVVAGQARSWRLQLPQLVRDFQQQLRLCYGMPRATLQSRLSPLLAPKSFEVLLQQVLAAEDVQLRGDLVTTPEWQPQPTAEEQQILQRLTDHYWEQKFQVKNCNETLGQLGLENLDSELYFSFLVQKKKLVRLSQENYLHADHYRLAEKLLVEHFHQQATLTLAQFRDRLDSGRKLTQALLENFDSCKYTRRDGDERVAWQLPEL